MFWTLALVTNVVAFFALTTFAYIINALNKR